MFSKAFCDDFMYYYSCSIFLNSIEFVLIIHSKSSFEGDCILYSHFQKAVTKLEAVATKHDH